jgi:hypothetical protein
MKHITYAEKSLLVGDRAADLALEYGAALATNGKADTINLHAFGADGDEVVATLLLDAGSNLMAETTHTSMEEPDNSEAEAYMQEHIALLSSPRTALPVDHAAMSQYDDQLDVGLPDLD